MRWFSVLLSGVFLAGCGSLGGSGSSVLPERGELGAAGFGVAFRESAYQAVSLSAFDQYDKRLLRPGNKYRLAGNLTHAVLADSSGRSAGRLEWYLFDGTRPKATGVGRSVHLSERQMAKQLKQWPSRAAGAQAAFDERLNVVVYVSVVAQDYPLRIDAVRGGDGRLVKS